ncbi:hypothetical protein V6N11_049226 [Hibiscus sabdariffa]|uniref:Uncharacterized protein n=1 Tax=Hibiscus sabdariffa TaxID=183260 RepID=A0ABR2NK46_9ROSI
MCVETSICWTRTILKLYKGGPSKGKSLEFTVTRDVAFQAQNSRARTLGFAFASSSRIQFPPFPDSTSATPVEPEVLSDLNTNQVIPLEQVQHEVSPQVDFVSQTDHVTPPAVHVQYAGSETLVSGEASQEQMPMSAHVELDTSPGINDMAVDVVFSGEDEEGEVPNDVVDGAALVMVEQPEGFQVQGADGDMLVCKLKKALSITCRSKENGYYDLEGDPVRLISEQDWLVSPTPFFQCGDYNIFNTPYVRRECLVAVDPPCCQSAKSLVPRTRKEVE